MVDYIGGEEVLKLEETAQEATVYRLLPQTFVLLVF